MCYWTVQCVASWDILKLSLRPMFFDKHIFRISVFFLFLIFRSFRFFRFLGFFSYIFQCIDCNIFDTVKRIWALGKCAMEMNYLLLLYSYPFLVIQTAKQWVFFSKSCEAREKKPTVRLPYNEFVRTRGFKNVVELSKICSQLPPSCEFDTLGD